MLYGGSRPWDGFWRLGGFASTIDHEARFLETKRSQALKSNIDHRITKHMLSGKNSEYFKTGFKPYSTTPLARQGPPMMYIMYVPTSAQ